MLEHFGFPCHNPKDEEVASTNCPRCGITIFERDDVYIDPDNGEIIGCPNCILVMEYEKEEEE